MFMQLANCPNCSLLTAEYAKMLSLVCCGLGAHGSVPYPFGMCSEVFVRFCCCCPGWFEQSALPSSSGILFFQDISDGSKILLQVEICCRRTSTGSVCLFSREMCFVSWKAKQIDLRNRSEELTFDVSI